MSRQTLTRPWLHHVAVAVWLAAAVVLSLILFSWLASLPPKPPCQGDQCIEVL